MVRGLKEFNQSSFKEFLQACSSNRFLSMFSGLGVTSVIQSSSATTVLVVGLIDAGLLNLTQALPMIMGANLGTTGTFWIISWLGYKFSLSKVIIPIAGLCLPLLFLKSPKANYLSQMFMGFVFLVLGLSFLKEAVPDIKQHPEAFAFVQQFSNQGFTSLLFYIGFGLVLTIIVQSSSVAGAITITMAFKGWITYPDAAAIILGENIGTTFTAHLATLRASTIAKQAAISHTIFNLLGLLWIIPLFSIMLGLVDFIYPGAPTAGHGAITGHLALFHTLFNAVTLIILLIALKPFVKLVQKIYPDTASEEQAPPVEEVMEDQSL